MRLYVILYAGMCILFAGGSFSAAVFFNHTRAAVFLGVMSFLSGFASSLCVDSERE